MCKLDGVPESQIKMRLFGFSLTGREKDWLHCLISGTIQTWTELKDEFLERFYTIAPFVERMDDASTFEQGDTESMHDSWERFKLLLKRCRNHNMRSMEQMEHFTRVLKAQVRMFLDA